MRSELELADWDDLFEPETSMPLRPSLSRRTSCAVPDRRQSDLRGGRLQRRAGAGRRAGASGSGSTHDPLLFLESIPLRETRIYVKKVLTNLWTYRDRLGQPRPSLEALARNEWPLYRALDAKPTIHAWN